jgi:hypothetical protein
MLFYKMFRGSEAWLPKIETITFRFNFKQKQRLKNERRKTPPFLGVI